MQAIAKHRHARISAQKARLVADQIRGKPVHSAFDLLTFSHKKAGELIKKVLYSAVANAEYNQGADLEKLKIFSIYVDEGPRMKRVKPRAKGKADRIIKRSCHITIIVSDSTRR